MVDAFQRSVNAQPAPAVEGDFASANPRRSMLAGPGELTAGALGVIVGRFGFARASTGVVQNASYGGGIPQRVGFIQRNQPAVITPWLGAATMTVQSGLELTLFDAGDFWARFAAGATLGQKVWASIVDGSAIASATAPAGPAITASLTANVMTVTVAGASALAPGMVVNFPGNPTIIAQLTGTPGGVGTYSMTAAADAAGGAHTTTGGIDTGFWVGSTTAVANGELGKITDQQPRG